MWGMNADGEPFSQPAAAVEVSRHGARITGAPHLKAPGEVVGVQHENLKARFRLIWMGQPDTPEHGQMGFECVDVDRYIWGLQVPPWVADTYVAPPPKPAFEAVAREFAGGPGADRRLHTRYPCSGQIELWGEGSPRDGAITGMLADISASGCYVQTMSPMPQGTRVQAAIQIDDFSMQARGEVRTVHVDIGMGLLFYELRDEDRARLNLLLDQLEQRLTQGSSYAPPSLGEAKDDIYADASRTYALTVLIELLEKKGVLEPGEFLRAIENRGQKS